MQTHANVKLLVLLENYHNRYNNNEEERENIPPDFRAIMKKKGLRQCEYVRVGKGETEELVLGKIFVNVKELEEISDTIVQHLGSFFSFFFFVLVLLFSLLFFSSSLVFLLCVCMGTRKILIRKPVSIRREEIRRRN